MENVSGKLNIAVTAEDERRHAFHARGNAPFVRAVRDASVVFEAADGMQFKAESGICEAEGSLTSLTGGEFQLSPFESAKITVLFKAPTYFLNAPKLYDIVSQRYVLNAKLYSKWEVNLWPLFLGHYLREGQWASTIECMREFGAQIVAEARRNASPQLRQLPKLKRLRKQIPIVAITRLNVSSTLREWSKKHWAQVYRKFFNSPHFEEMNANAEFLRRILQQGDGLVALRSVREGDDFAFAMPFEAATAQSLSCGNLMGLTRKDGSNQSARRTTVASSLQFDSVTLGPMPLPCELAVEQVQIPFITGFKQAYAATMTAPIILKGKSVTGTLSRNTPDVKRRLRSRFRDFVSPGKLSDPSENPADLRIRIDGHEA